MLENVKIVSDSTADVFTLDTIPFASAPLKIMVGDKEYIDDENLNVEHMVDALLKSKEKSGTACPAISDWFEAFGDAKHIFCITITSALSGSYNSACIAKDEFLASHPESKVFVIDSLSAGPELKLIIEKLEELISIGHSFEEICNLIVEYQKHTGLLFMLESLKNLANNGRVNKLVAGAVGILGVRITGKASDKGELELISKTRGEAKTLPAVLDILHSEGYLGKKLRISHCFNEPCAQKLKQLVLEKYPTAQIEIYPARGLCSFYAEKGGLLIGFEK